MKLYTIGFTQHSAEAFFEKLNANKIKTLIDIRISNNSQLAGFTKSTDLPYFLQITGNIKYLSKPELAPTKELLRKYRNKDISWDLFSTEYLKQIQNKNILNGLDPEIFNDACLLCSEHDPHNCHRRLLAQILNQMWDLEIIHL